MQSGSGATGSAGPAPALPGLPEGVPVVIRDLVERAKLEWSGAVLRLRRPGRDAERAGDGRRRPMLDVDRNVETTFSPSTFVRHTRLGSRSKGLASTTLWPPPSKRPMVPCL